MHRMRIMVRFVSYACTVHSIIHVACNDYRVFAVFCKETGYNFPLHENVREECEERVPAKTIRSKQWRWMKIRSPPVLRAVRARGLRVLAQSNARRYASHCNLPGFFKLRRMPNVEQVGSLDIERRLRNWWIKS